MWYNKHFIQRKVVQYGWAFLLVNIITRKNTVLHNFPLNNLFNAAASCPRLGLMTFNFWRHVS